MEVSYLNLEYPKFHCGNNRIHRAVTGIREYLRYNIKLGFMNNCDPYYITKDIYKQSFLDILRTELDDENNRDIFKDMYKPTKEYYKNNLERLTDMVVDLFVDFNKQYNLTLDTLPKDQYDLYVKETVDLFIIYQLTEKAKYYMFTHKKKTLDYIDYNKREGYNGEDSD
jgi:hypothetical protein